jgi:hypothetical protein
MFRRKEPATEMELQWERREKRLLAYLIGIPALLLLTFTAFYFTPWEISYRQHGVTVTAYYSRNELCAPFSTIIGRSPQPTVGPTREPCSAPLTPPSMTSTLPTPVTTIRVLLKAMSLI